MSKEQFLDTLRRRLAGMSAAEADEVIADYRMHFDEGVAAGRSEQEIAAALGDPIRLARELRAEAGVRRWEEARTPGNFFTAVFGLLALIAVDFMFLLPVLGTLLAVAIAGVAGVLIMCFTGIFLMFSLFSLDIVSTLGGLALLGFGVGCGALLLMLGDLIVRGLAHFVRLHFTLFNRASQTA
jgi:uncharacterized membrane protein